VLLRNFFQASVSTPYSLSLQILTYSSTDLYEGLVNSALIMKKVVIINDNADFLEAIKMLLEDEGGYTTCIIHEGKTAFKKVKEEKPDLIILDIRMESPVMGWKILDLLTLDPVTSKIPVIICTASAELIKQEKHEWLNTHGIAVLPKPFDADDLFALLERAFRPKRKKPTLQELN
jgi:CheY-like chemotaxis protein